MKFIKPLYGVKTGEIYPTQFEAGDDCPPELECAAKETGALQAGGKRAAKADDQPTGGE